MLVNSAIWRQLPVSLSAALKHRTPVLRASASSLFHSYSAEPSQPLNRSPVLCSTPLEAVKCIESGE